MIFGEQDMNMSWFKEHKDAVYVMGSIALGVYSMMASMHNSERRTDAKLAVIEKEINSMKTDIAIIKYVMTANRPDLKSTSSKEIALGMINEKLK